jgi:formylglycine-generating enzyme required for sulfatase activity
MRVWITSGSLLTTVIVAVGASGSCAEGIAPPVPTAMVEIRQGLDFAFGTDEWCFNESQSISQRATCDGDAGTEFPILWPTLKVRLKPFAIDIHEVTNLQYRYCVAMGVCENGDDSLHPANAFSITQSDYYDNPTFDHYPVVRVTWQQAADYCAFVGKRLPSEFEWERVAKGPDSVNRPFPADGLTELSQCKGDNGFASGYCRTSTDMARVLDTQVDFVTEANGSRIFQLFGNAAEWTATAFVADVTCDEDGPCARVDQCPSGPSGDVCRIESKNCAACPKDGGQPPRNVQSDECFFMCLGESRETIVCKPYDADAQPVAAETLGSSAGNRVVRGGSVATRESTTCEFTPTYRNRSREPNNLQEGDVGFRCARDL